MRTDLYVMVQQERKMIRRRINVEALEGRVLNSVTMADGMIDMGSRRGDAIVMSADARGAIDLNGNVATIDENRGEIEDRDGEGVHTGAGDRK